MNNEKGSAPPDYIQSQLNHQQPGLNNFQHASNPNYNQPQPLFNMGMNNPQPNQPQMGMNNSQFNQPQAPYPTGMNDSQFNQPQAPYPTGMNNSQFNQPQAPYPMGMNNSQFNQPQAPYPMGVNNPQFIQSQPNINSPQMPYINNTVINNNVASPPQNSNIINVNVNQSNQEKTVLVGVPESHMCLSIFSCLCCFWPLGLVAIIKSYEVDSAFARGEYNRALSASLSARLYARISIGLGFLAIIVVVIIFTTGVLR